MKELSIAVLAGDGIGPEVMASGLEILSVVEAGLSDVRFSLRHFSVGAGEYLKNGDPLPPATLGGAAACDAILLGAMGLPEVRWPGGLEMTPQIDLREKLDLYNGVRPIHLYHETHSPLKGYGAGDIDFVIVRENTEGLFSDRLKSRQPDADSESDSLRITRRGAERIARAAFELARKRDGRRKVTLADKANVLPSMAFFRNVFDSVAGAFADVEADHAYIDALAVHLLQRPEQFDVIVTENMFGDILSDLCAGLIGGMGLAPSADIGDRHAVFQPAHGTAPDIAGQNCANPVAMVLSVAMMLDWFDIPETRRAAAAIGQAVAAVLADPAHRTGDLGGSLGTREMTDLITQTLSNHL